MTTIKDLINVLSQYPPDKEIVFADFDEGLEKEILYIGITEDNKICISELENYWVKDEKYIVKKIKNELL